MKTFGLSYREAIKEPYIIVRLMVHIEGAVNHAVSIKADKVKNQFGTTKGKKK